MIKGLFFSLSICFSAYITEYVTGTRICYSLLDTDLVRENYRSLFNQSDFVKNAQNEDHIIVSHVLTWLFFQTTWGLPHIVGIMGNVHKSIRIK